MLLYYFVVSLLFQLRKGRGVNQKAHFSQKIITQLHEVQEIQADPRLQLVTHLLVALFFLVLKRSDNSSVFFYVEIPLLCDLTIAVCCLPYLSALYTDINCNMFLLKILACYLFIQAALVSLLQNIEEASTLWQYWALVSYQLLLLAFSKAAPLYRRIRYSDGYVSYFFDEPHLWISEIFQTISDNERSEELCFLKSSYAPNKQPYAGRCFAKVLNNKKHRQQCLESEPLAYNQLCTSYTPLSISSTRPKFLHFYHKLNLVIVTCDVESDLLSPNNYETRNNLWLLSFPSFKPLASLRLTGESLENVSSMPAIFMRAHQTKLIIAYYAYVMHGRSQVYFFDVRKRGITQQFAADVSALKFFFSISDEKAEAHDVLVYQDDEQRLMMYDCKDQSVHTIWQPNRDQYLLGDQFELVEKNKILVSIDPVKDSRGGIYIYDCARRSISSAGRKYCSFMYPMPLEGEGKGDFYVLRIAFEGGARFVMYRGEAVDCVYDAQRIFYGHAARAFTLFNYRGGKIVVTHQKASMRMVQCVDQNAMKKSVNSDFEAGAGEQIAIDIPESGNLSEEELQMY